LVPDISNNVFCSILRGATERLNADDYTVIVADVGDDERRQIELAAGLVARRVDGFVLATVRKDDPLVAFCLNRGLPAVLVNRSEAQARVSAVVSDDEAGMRLAVSHLVELGHREIGHVAGPSEHSTGHLRRKGFLNAMGRNDLSGKSAVQLTKAYSRVDGAIAAGKLLDHNPRTTAIVAANDLLALGVYDALRERGLRCPEDISVVGHNDMPLVDIVKPPLTTVRIDHQDMGAQAAELLRRAIDDPGGASRNLILQPTLVIRRSTAKPAHAAERKQHKRAP